MTHFFVTKNSRGRRNTDPILERPFAVNIFAKTILSSDFSSLAGSQFCLLSPTLRPRTKKIYDRINTTSRVVPCHFFLIR